MDYQDRVTNAVISQSRGNPRKGLILAFLSVSTFMVFLDTDVVNTALPAMARDFAASNSVLQWVVNMYSLMLAGFLLLAGTTGDRFGRKNAYAFGMVVFGAGAVGAALSENAGTLIAMRGVQGLGAAFALPSTLSIITDVFPREERAKAIATWTAVSSLSIIFGPALGGFIVDQIDWNAVFWLHVPLVAIALYGLTVIPESRDSRRRPLDVPGAVLGTSGVLAIVYGIIQGGEAGWTSPGILAAFAGGGALLCLFGWSQLKSSHPMMPLGYFRRPDFTGGFLVMMLLFMGVVGVFFFLTQFFQLVQDRSAFMAGLALAPSAAGMIGGAGIAGKGVPKYGPRLVAIAGVLVTMVAMGLFTQIQVDTPYWVVAAGIATFGLGLGIAIPTVTDTIMASVPVDDAGVGSAMNDMSREFGIALGVAIVGSVVTSIYRSNAVEALRGLVPERITDVVKESVGAVESVAAELPSDVGAMVISAADKTFVDAINIGYLAAGGFTVAALVAAAALLPSRMRPKQAELQHK